MKKLKLQKEKLTVQVAVSGRIQALNTGRLTPNPVLSHLSDQMNGYGKRVLNLYMHLSVYTLKAVFQVYKYSFFPFILLELFSNKNQYTHCKKIFNFIKLHTIESGIPHNPNSQDTCYDHFLHF